MLSNVEQCSPVGVEEKYLRHLLHGVHCVWRLFAPVALDRVSLYRRAIHRDDRVSCLFMGAKPGDEQASESFAYKPLAYIKLLAS